MRQSSKPHLNIFARDLFITWVLVLPNTGCIRIQAIPASDCMRPGQALCCCCLLTASMFGGEAGGEDEEEAE